MTQGKTWKIQIIVSYSNFELCWCFTKADWSSSRKLCAKTVITGV